MLLRRPSSHCRSAAEIMLDKNDIGVKLNAQDFTADL